MRKTFPNVPIIPAMGNHDFHPVNYYNTGHRSQSALTAIAEIWSQFIGDDLEALESFKVHGYYRYDLPVSVSRGNAQKVSIIVMNSQSCYNMNFGLMNETNDAASQLEWFREQLRLAEAENRLVFVAAHIAPGCNTCVAKWGQRYTILFERYQHIIRLAVFGHDHRELYEIVRSTSTDRPIGVHHVAGSLGTYFYVNPSIRLYKMHAKHHVPLDTQILEFNID